jgi:preprotein translocase subunit SecG
MTNYSAPQPAAGTGEDPGKTLGIVGLVLAFVFALAGIIVSAIALKKSKEAGFQNTIAKVGLILSIVFLVIGLIVGGLTFAATLAAIDAGVSTY